jgi:hypothetical protein
MASRKLKSKKPSNTWKLLEAQFEFFLDRNQGNKIVPELLRKVGLRVVCHSDKFTDDMTPDPIWLDRCAREEWIVITGDKAIETDPINRQAVIDCRAKVILLEENNSRALEWASAIIVARRRMVEIVHDNDGPFFVSLRKNSDSLFTAIRRP